MSHTPDQPASGARPLRVLVAGLRSPEAEGGVESHARHLYPHIAELGCDVEIAVRRHCHPVSRADQWGRIRLKPFWSPVAAGFEALLHTLLATAYAIRSRPDVYHLHAIGPALLTPLACMFGLKVVVTHHGPDYDREKWGAFSRLVLRLGEWLGMRCAHGRIVISSTIHDLVRDKYGLDSTVIPNGVDPPAATASTALLDALGLTPKRYVLQVSRFVPEKRQADLVAAFRGAELGEGWHLVLVGDSGPGNRYAQRVRAAAGGDERVLFTGYRTGEDLLELCQNAAVFVLPSSHEGLPIALLEALSHGLPVIASDIPANREIGLPDHWHFPVGDVEALARRLEEAARRPASEQDTAVRRQDILERYNWQHIARQTAAVYRSVLAG